MVLLVAGPTHGESEQTASVEAEGRNLFESRIRPILVEHCYSCHSAEAKSVKGGLRLDTREGLQKGGHSGPVVVPGHPEESLLIDAISYAEGFEKMPPKAKLPSPVIADFRKWIEMGAPDPRSLATQESSQLANATKDGETTDPLDWWSLRRLSRPVVPQLDASGARWARTPVDAFVHESLQSHGLTPSPEADRRTLIRRLSFDLTGLPPTPEDVRRFLADDAPDAYEQLVDRLLASPHYGERWARHWMDLVHFAETHGHDQDRIRPNAWPYRDYLIESFNRDTPYDQFVREQIAADVLYPNQPGQAVALGMIAAGPWDESSLRDIRDDSIDRQIGHYIDRDDMVATVMSTFASVTVHCARCHDHKFDPISQREYYGLQAVFAGVDRAERAYDVDPVVASLRQALRSGLLASGSSNLGLLEQLAALPRPRLVYAAASDFMPDAGHKPPGGPRPVSVLRRGDIHHPIAPAEPGALSCVPWLESRFQSTDPSDEGSRRASLARWLSDSQNPLTWRSIVNRVWQNHFGRGIVDTPSDFGRMGASPTHPELLDWLAVELIENGGSLKHLHRLMVTSATYRQASLSRPESARLDSDNRWLWRMNATRLDAESVHDAILQASGRLDTTMGGPSVQQFHLSPGVHVTPVVDYTQYDWESPGAGRRSVYRFLFRTLPDPFMDRLDGADASQLVASRSESASPLQALAMLNNSFVLNASKHLGQRLEAERGCLEERVSLAYELLFGRLPGSSERAEAAEFASRFGLANLARVLFNSSEFLFVD
jgi:hypothetical protein